MLISHVEANAVARIDNLEFLSDVIPRTTTFREYKERKERKARLAEPLPNGQTTLGQPRNLPRRPAGINGFDGGKAVKGVGFDGLNTRGNENARDVPLNKKENRVEVDYERHDDSDDEEREDVEMG